MRAAPDAGPKSERAGSPSRKASRLAALILFAAMAGIYAAGALSADPETGIARPDFDVVRQWQRTGKLVDHPSGAHLTKPGYLAYLRGTIPSGGDAPVENRRFLILSALWICLGVALGAWSLSVNQLRWAAAGFLAYALVHTGLRDSADYVAGEPLATGAGLAFVALLIAVRRKTLGGWASAGALAALLYLLRPNLGALCFAIAAALVLSGAPGRVRPLLALIGGAAIGIALLVGLASVTGQGIRPFKADSAKALLWGTADYYWRPDIGSWPQGGSPSETARLEAQSAAARWRSVFGQPRSDAVRSMTWRASHLFLSSEQLPPRWQSPVWLRIDAAARRWWWCAAMLAACASVASALGGRGEWRWIPILICAGLIAQGIAFGADPRLALPLFPLLMLSLAAALPAVRWSGRCLAGAAVTAAFGGVALWLVPESANSDFALVRGPGHVIEQAIPGSRITRSHRIVVHVRLLKPDSVRMGWEILANDRIVSTHRADAAPSPAFQTFSLSGEDLADVRRRGLTLRIRTIGDASTRDGYVYYPVAPSILDGPSTVDGDARLPSLWSHSSRGGLPIWWHAAGVGE
jgi:hypothetical protein